MENGEWAMDNGEWAMDNGELIMENYKKGPITYLESIK